MQQLNDGALSLLYDFGKAFVSTSRISLAFGRHMISEHHAAAEIAVLQSGSAANNFRRQHDACAASLENDYVYKNDDHDSRQGGL